ncbi:MAG: endonuclease I family protein, partial [Candidatus Kapaibacterium sp.]
DAAEQSKLFDTLRSRVTGHTSLGYKAAREVMFGKADNVSDSVECIYTGKKLKTAGIPPNGEFNTEHSWPQSFGSSAEPNKSDIYHLYPTNPNANSMRANYPFGMISKVWKDATGGSRLGFTATGDTVFEPRDVAKGNIARGLFYYFLRYGNLFNYYQSPYAMDADLRRWNEQDPPDAQERRRGDTIAAYQGKRNPFIDYPQFIERMEYVPVNRSAMTIVPAVQTVGDDVSGAVLIAHVLNRG